MTDSSIIYDPAPPLVELRTALSRGVVAAGVLAAVDHVSDNDKPWQFYAGAALGAMAVATGIPGAAATLYVVGDVLESMIFKNEDSSDMQIFVNGIAFASLETFALASTWEWFQITLNDAMVNRVDFVNNGPGANNSTGTAWMSLGSFRVNGLWSQPKGIRKTRTWEEQHGIARTPTPYRVTYTIRDEKGALSKLSYHVERFKYIDSMGSHLLEPASDVEYYAWFMASLLDEIIDGQIINIAVTATVQRRDFAFLTHENDLKAAPAPSSDVEHRLALSYRVQDAPPFVHYVPSITRSLILPDGTADLSDEALDDFTYNFYSPENAEIGADWLIAPCDNRGARILELLSAYEDFKAR